MPPPRLIEICEGNLLDQEVEVIVNAWNRNIFPWWLLLPQGVSGAIKRRGGVEPFRQLARMKMIPLGGAVETTAGSLPFKSIIHIAGISLLWRTSERAIREGVANALDIAAKKGYQSIAFPLIGAGTGGFSPDRVLEIMRKEVEKNSYSGQVILVRFKK